MCLAGFTSLSYADDMGKPKEGMKGETMKKDEMKGEMKEHKGEMKSKPDAMKGTMKKDGMKHDDMKSEMKGKTGEMGK
jgi:hypothetical protein